MGDTTLQDRIEELEHELEWTKEEAIRDEVIDLFIDKFHLNALVTEELYEFKEILLADKLKIVK